MFNDFESSGKHLVCDLKGIKNIELLNNYDGLKNLMKDICKIHDYQILNEIEYKFEPIGCTIILLLSESHMSIHTFPEKNHISFDLYTCRQYKDNGPYNNVIELLKTRLIASDSSTFKIIDRCF
jgi:S-adenosylmethionine decarboxylase